MGNVPKLGGMFDLRTVDYFIGENSVQEVFLRTFVTMQIFIMMHERCGNIVRIPRGVDNFRFNSPQLLWKQS